MHLNSWDYYDLEKEMQDASVGKLLDLYKRENKKYSDKCAEYFKFMSKLSEDDKKALEKECEFFEGARMKLALQIAEHLTK